MFAGLIAGHQLAYRLVYSDAHARADALARSGHAYFGYVPLALTVSLGVLVAGLALQTAAGLRGETPHPMGSPLIVLLPPIAFVVQEFAERIVHTGQVPWTVVVQPALLLGLAFQLPFALAALLIAWALDSAARAVGRALSHLPVPEFQIPAPKPVRVAAVPRTAGLARGYGERAPPFARRP
jgi:low temperature requirement protein LtrA